MHLFNQFGNSFWSVFDYSMFYSKIARRMLLYWELAYQSECSYVLVSPANTSDFSRFTSVSFVCSLLNTVRTESLITVIYEKNNFMFESLTNLFVFKPTVIISFILLMDHGCCAALRQNLVTHFCNSNTWTLLATAEYDHFTYWTSLFGNQLTCWNL